MWWRIVPLLVAAGILIGATAAGLAQYAGSAGSGVQTVTGTGGGITCSGTTNISCSANVNTAVLRNYGSGLLLSNSTINTTSGVHIGPGQAVDNNGTNAVPTKLLTFPSFNTTGTITTGTNVLVVSDATNMAPGLGINVAGASFPHSTTYILTTSGVNITVKDNAGATATNAAVSSVTGCEVDLTQNGTVGGIDSATTLATNQFYEFFIIGGNATTSCIAHVAAANQAPQVTPLPTNYTVFRYLGQMTTDITGGTTNLVSFNQYNCGRFRYNVFFQDANGLATSGTPINHTVVGAPLGIKAELDGDWRATGSNTRVYSPDLGFDPVEASGFTTPNGFQLVSTGTVLPMDGMIVTDIQGRVRVTAQATGSISSYIRGYRDPLLWCN